MAIMSGAVARARYKRKTAANYEKRRVGQRRWKLENAAVERWLQHLHPTRILDVPVGTGRLIPIYQKLGFVFVGVDISDDMLHYARNRIKGKRGGLLYTGDAMKLVFEDKEFGISICLRLFHLINQGETHQVLRELDRVTRDMIICTARLAKRTSANVASVTLDENWFLRTIRKLGWKIADEEKLSHAGWRIMKLERINAQSRSGDSRPHAARRTRNTAKQR